MVRFKYTWLSWLTLAVVVLTSSVMSPVSELEQEVKALTTQVSELQTQLEATEKCYEEELGVLRAQVQQSAELVSDPINLVQMLYKKKGLFKDIRKAGKLYGTNIELVGPWVDPRLSPELYAAFLDCAGPIARATSGRRYDNPKSCHFHGNALDIRYDSTGVSFVKWMITEEGTQWRNKYAIDFYIEDRYKSSPIFKTFAELKPFHFVNSRATGPHIHLFVQNRKDEIEIKHGTTRPNIS